MSQFAEKIKDSFFELVKSLEEKKPENLTINVFGELDNTVRTLFTYLDESRTIKDIQEDESLRIRMVDLFKDERSSGALYLNQINQDKCYATKGCVLALGSKIYKTSNCKSHYVCGEHKNLPCRLCLKKQSATGNGEQEEPPEKDRTDDILPANASASQTVPVQTKADDDAEESKALTEPSNGKKEKKINETGDEIDKQVTDLQKTFGNMDLNGGEGSTNGHKSVAEKEEKTNKKKELGVAFEVKDASGLSMDDFSFKPDEHVKTVYICQVLTKDGRRIWVEEAEYAKMKMEKAIQQSKVGDEGSDDGVLANESMHKENEHVGK